MTTKPFYRSPRVRAIEAVVFALLTLLFVAEISASQPDHQPAFAPSAVKEVALNNPNLHPSLRRYVAVVNSRQEEPAWQRQTTDRPIDYSSLGGDIHELPEHFPQD